MLARKVCSIVYMCVFIIEGIYTNLFFNLFKDGYLKLSKTYIFK